MRYKAYGEAPNRYLIIKWYRMEAPDGQSIYSFLVVLHENGDIVFQYDQLTFLKASTACGTAGIEDETGAVSYTHLRAHET